MSTQDSESPTVAEGMHVYLGDCVCVKVGSGDGQVTFHCQRSVLSTKFNFFADMASEHKKQNLFWFPNDDSQLWQTILGLAYDTSMTLSFAKMRSVMPLCKFLGSTSLLEGFAKTLRDLPEDERTAEHVDFIVDNGMCDILDDWFGSDDEDSYYEDSAWAVRVIPLFLEDCKSAEAVRMIGFKLLRSFRTFVASANSWVPCRETDMINRWINRLN
jgi:hypothetical protein